MTSSPLLETLKESDEANRFNASTLKNRLRTVKNSPIFFLKGKLGNYTISLKQARTEPFFLLRLSALFEDFKRVVDRQVHKLIDKICGVKIGKNLLIR